MRYKNRGHKLSIAKEFYFYQQSEDKMRKAYALARMEEYELARAIQTRQRQEDRQARTEGSTTKTRGKRRQAKLEPPTAANDAQDHALEASDRAMGDGRSRTRSHSADPWLAG